ncbi:MAG TPA: hypothetical protein PK413_07470 [Thermoanaerobaculia bacterium]|nr:hypothetical protein [Thermoanaerobaculia bacterium]
MLESLRRQVAAVGPQVSLRTVFSLGCVGGFALLLAQDQVHPFVVYLLQLYLSF